MVASNVSLFNAPSSLEALSDNEPWHDFVTKISSLAYRTDMLKWLRRQFSASTQKSTIYGEFLSKRLEVDENLTLLECEFSSLSSGALLAPHTDSPTKYIGCVLYFAPSDWNAKWGGATEVYAPKTKSTNGTGLIMDFRINLWS